MLAFSISYGIESVCGALLFVAGNNFMNRSFLTKVLLVSLIAGYAQAAVMTKSIGPYGGNVLDLISHPMNPATIFAATSNRGIYVSNNFGLTWNRMDEAMMLGNPIPSMADEDADIPQILTGNVPVYRTVRVSPSDYKRVVIFDPPFWGIVISNDIGNTWKRIPFESAHVYDPDYCGLGSGISGRAKLIDAEFDQFDENTLYLLYEHSLLSIKLDSTGNASDIECVLFEEYVDYYDLEVSYFDKGHLYLGTRRGGLYQSKDGGLSWDKNGKLFGVLSIELDPFTPNLIYLYVEDALLRSADGGETWDAVLSSTQAKMLDADTMIRADPTRPGLVYFVSYRGVLYSGDYGKTWNQHSAYWSTPLGVVFYDITEEDNEVLKTNVILPNPLDKKLSLIAGSLGVWRYVDKARSESNFGMDATNINVLAIDPNDNDTIYGGFGFFGGTILKNEYALFKTNNGGLNWSAIKNGFYAQERITDIQINPLNTDNLYVSSFAFWNVFQNPNQPPNWHLWDNGYFIPVSIKIADADPNIVYVTVWDNFYRSDDGGNTFNKIITCPTGSCDEYSDRDILTDPFNPNIVYLRSGRYYSTDKGVTWAKTNLPFDGDLFIHPLDVNSRIVFSGGDIRYSDNAGLAWHASNFSDVSLMQSGDEYQISFDYSNNKLVAVSDSNLLSSHDGGMTWSFDKTFERQTAQPYLTDIDIGRSNGELLRATKYFSILTDRNISSISLETTETKLDSLGKQKKYTFFIENKGTNSAAPILLVIDILSGLDALSDFNKSICTKEDFRLKCNIEFLDIGQKQGIDLFFRSSEDQSILLTGGLSAFDANILNTDHVVIQDVLGVSVNYALSSPPLYVPEIISGNAYKLDFSNLSDIDGKTKLTIIVSGGYIDDIRIKGFDCAIADSQKIWECQGSMLSRETKTANVFVKNDTHSNVALFVSIEAIEGIDPTPQDNHKTYQFRYIYQSPENTNNTGATARTGGSGTIGYLLIVFVLFFRIFVTTRRT